MILGINVEQLIKDIPSFLYKWFLVGGFKIVFLLIAAWIGLSVLHVIIRKVLRTSIEKTYKGHSHEALDKRTNTLEAVIFSSVKVAIWIIVGLIILSELGIDIGPLLAAAGIVGLAFGFGGQYLIRDLIAGLFIILEDQYRKGDVIKISDISGTVEEITLRKTTLRDLDGIEHHIPNGEISTTSNFTKVWSRINLNIGISYDSDLQKAIDILNEIGKEIAQDEEWKDSINEPPKVLGVDDFGESEVTLKILGETKPGKQWAATRELRKRIKLRFDKEGIEIPYPHRTIVQK